jgi:non-heme chloroperoxidase
MQTTINRRELVQRAAGMATATATVGGTQPVQPMARRHESSFVVAQDGTKLFVQDWGRGRPVVFLSAWTFHSNVWEGHIAAMTAHEFRCIAPDRRGHGRSEAPNSGYDLDTLTDDVAAVIEALDLRDIVLVAHSMGSVEAVRYCAGRGSKRVARLVLAAPVTPFITKTSDNPEAYRRNSSRHRTKRLRQISLAGSPRMNSPSLLLIRPGRRVPGSRT